MLEIQSQGPARKTRKRHHKSKTGCFECKRRRVKCDEKKPSCTRCVLGLDKCMYPSAPQLIPNSSCSEPPPSFEASPSPTLICVEASRCSNALDAPETLSDAGLYHHYLQHTCHTLSLCQSDYSALHIGMPTLALQSEMVFHSLLAVSAAGLAWDMISKEPPPDTQTVEQVLLAGYKHYNLASERTRESISAPDTLKLEPLIASALMLVPFATASQQINHWISITSGAQKSPKLLSSTPRDVIIIMKGIRAMLQTLGYGGFSTDADLSPETECRMGRSSALPAANPRFIAPPSSRTHVMSAMVASTSRVAFSKLRQRLDSVFFHQNGCSDHSLSACRAAFEILDQIRSSAFNTTNSTPSPSFSPPVADALSPEPTRPLQIAPWLRSLAARSFATQSTSAGPRPTDPLTRFFLSFLVRAPQAYLDLALPLLDQRLESPPIGGASSDHSSSIVVPAELTPEQALALDIYAHWSVLMFLVEEESWWIGTLPEVTLAGLVNRYGRGFGSGENGPGEQQQQQQQQWWPGSMLGILRDIKRYR